MNFSSLHDSPHIHRLNFSILRDGCDSSLDTTTHSSAGGTRDIGVSPFKIFSFEHKEDKEVQRTPDSSCQPHLASNVTRMFLEERDLMQSIGLISLKNPLDSLRTETARMYTPVTYDESLFTLIEALEAEL